MWHELKLPSHEKSKFALIAMECVHLAGRIHNHFVDIRLSDWNKFTISVSESKFASKTWQQNALNLQNLHSKKYGKRNTYYGFICFGIFVRVEENSVFTVAERVLSHPANCKTVSFCFNSNYLMDSIKLKCQPLVSEKWMFHFTFHNKNSHMTSVQTCCHSHWNGFIHLAATL